MLSFLLFASLSPAAPGEPAPLATIRAGDLRAHVEFLASDDLEGREAGTESERVAAAYLASRLHSYGLKPAGEGGSWYQEFDAGGRRMRNVVGVLEGTDPALRGEVVVVGAHFDHVGRGGAGGFGPRGEVHNGADDNASGTAAVLELAQAFATAPARRTLVFAHFSGEEKGLLGSVHYTKAPALPLASTVAMLNLDMIGRSVERYLFVGGVGTSPEWPARVARTGEAEGLRLETAAGGKAPSDNTPFYEKGIPCLFFFTNVHEDYHGPGDDAEKIDYAGVERIARASWRLLSEVADADARPAFTEADAQGLPADFGKRMQERFGARAGARASRLGVRTAKPESGEGLLVKEVLPSSAAEAAGILEGDLLLAVGETKVGDEAELRRAMRDAANSGGAVVVRLRRRGEARDVEVRVPARPASGPARPDSGPARNP